MNPCAPLILLVHENPRLNEDLASCLIQEGFQVITADSCLTAISLVDSQEIPQIDLLLAPGHTSLMSGTDLARWIQDFHPELQFLLIGDPETQDDALRGNFVPQPIDAGTLLQKVRDCTAPLAQAA